MMKKLFLIGVITLAQQVCWSQKDYSVCDKFKIGTFEIVGKKGQSHIIMSRSESRQIEVNKRNADTYAYEVQWLSDCQYKLIMMSSNTKKGKKGDSFIVSIFPKNHDTYEYSIRSTSSKKKKSYTVRKIGDGPSKLY